MADEAVEELFVRGWKLAVHHSAGAGKTATGTGPGGPTAAQGASRELCAAAEVGSVCPKRGARPSPETKAQKVDP